jgi:hypothetical protein
MFGADEYGASSFGEVLAILRQIKAGDYDSWYDAWNAAGDRLAAEADGQLARGHKVSARDNYLRAASYSVDRDKFSPVLGRGKQEARSISNPSVAPDR